MWGGGGSERSSFYQLNCFLKGTLNGIYFLFQQVNMSDLLLFPVNVLDLLAKLQYAVSAATVSRLPRYHYYINIIFLMNKKQIALTNLYFAIMYFRLRQAPAPCDPEQRKVGHIEGIQEWR